MQFLQGFARAACENLTRDGTECAMDAYAYAMQSIYLAEASLLGVRAASIVNRIPSGRSISYYDRRKTFGYPPLTQDFFERINERSVCANVDNMYVESGQAETKCFRKINDCLDRNLRHARPSDEQYVKIRTSSTWNVVRYRVPSVWKHVWPRTE